MRVGAVALVGMAVPSRPRVVAGMGPHGPRHSTPGASTTRGRLGEPSLPRVGPVIEFQHVEFVGEPAVGAGWSTVSYGTTSMR